MKQLECDCGLGPKAPSSDASGAVTFVEALDRRGEALSAARRARQFVRGGGRYRDVLVLCRDINDYAEAMGAAFTEYGIPCFIDRRRTVAHHPVLQLLNAALMILIRAWPHEAIMSAIKSGLVGLSPDQADELESYCLRHRIHGEHAWTSERSWLYRRIGARDGEEDTPVNDSGAAKSADYLRRKVAKPLAKLQAAMCVDGNSNLKSQISDFRFQISNSEAGISESPPPSPVRQRSPQAGAPGEGERHVSPVAHGRGAPATVGPIAGDEQSNSKSGIQNPKSTADDQSQTGNLTIARRVAALFDFFETLNIRRTLGLWMNVAEKAGDIEQRDEHEQVWNRVTDLFDEMIDVLGEREVSLADFAEIVQSGLESFDLALTPPTIDQVLVGQIDRTRSSRTRLTILLGMNEGQFPRPATEDSILNDAERGELKRQDFDLEDDSQRRRMDEDLMAYIAMTRSSDQLLLLRSIYDEKGNPAAPGLFWLELRQRFADQPLIGAGESAAQIDTERQLLERLMGWVRGENPPDAILLNLYQWCRPRLGADNLWSRIWRALSYENKAQLSAAKAQSLFGQPLRISVSQVEQLARCPFKHFLRYGLLLEPPVEQEPTAIDLGNVYHQSLERFVSALLREKLDLASLPRGHADELIDQCAREVGATLNEELMISSARNQHLLSWIGQNLKMVAAAQQAAAQRGDFRPAATELSFGSDANDPSIEVTSPNGHLVQLRGRIDRVDLDRATGAFAVIDYKSSARNLQLFRVGHGLMLQLLVYMLILQWHGAELMGQDLKPAAGLYVELSRKKEQVKNPAEAPEPGDGKFDLRIRPRGVIQQEFIAQLDHQWQQNDAPVLSAKINKDGSIPKAGSDLFTPEELKVLLKFARRKVGELADQILQGCIDIHPYRIGTETACAGCEYKSVCRFQPAPGAYLDIPRLKREAAIEMMSEQMDYDASGDLAEPRGDGR